jgi:hypothetical protein
MGIVQPHMHTLRHIAEQPIVAGSSVPGCSGVWGCHTVSNAR